MQSITSLFSDFPVYAMDFYKKSVSVSGKTESEVLSVSNLSVYLQADDGNLSVGLLAGSTYTGYIDTTLLNGTKIEVGDSLKNDGYQYKVIACMLEDSSPDIIPFYHLTLEKLNKA